MHTSMCSIDNGPEMKLWAFSIRCPVQNDFAPDLDVSALLATISLPVTVAPFPGLNSSGNPPARIYTAE